MLLFDPQTERVPEHTSAPDAVRDDCVLSGSVRRYADGSLYPEEAQGLVARVLPEQAIELTRIADHIASGRGNRICPVLKLQD